MSYEYEDKRRMSFGQILLSLLLLGVVVVIGLIVLVYFKLTSNDKRVIMPAQEASAPVLAVEKMTPDGRPASETPPVINASNSTASAPHSNNNTANRRQTADDAVNDINKDNNLNNNTFSNRALTNGNGQTVRRPRPVRRANPDATAENSSASRSRRSTNHYNSSAQQQGEVPLQPINTQRERTLTPRNRNNTGERELTPRRSNGSAESSNRTIRFAPQVERELKPVHPQQNNRQSGAVDQLF